MGQSIVIKHGRVLGSDGNLHVADVLIERGTIVNVSSISAYATSSNRADYCIAKSGLQI